MLIVLDCNNLCSSDGALEEYDLVLRCFKLWMMCYDHDDNDHAIWIAGVGFSSKMFHAHARFILCKPALAHGLRMDRAWGCTRTPDFVNELRADG